MNILIGVLCKVIDAVAEIEKEQILVNFVKHSLVSVLQESDLNNDHHINKNEFNIVLQDERSKDAIKELGVDFDHLLSLRDTIFEQEFEDDGNGEGSLSWKEFLDMLLNLRA